MFTKSINQSQQIYDPSDHEAERVQAIFDDVLQDFVDNSIDLDEIGRKVSNLIRIRFSEGYESAEAKADQADQTYDYEVNGS